MSVIWTEKYRPKDFSEIIGQESIVARVKALVESKNMPHLLFVGPAGTGKTSLAMVVAKKLFGDSWKENFLELNASDERGIDVIRIKVKDFARTKAIGNVPFKIIYLDESDALTREAQQALRRTMENFTKTCRFILSANYSTKIIEPIQSRCAIFRFKKLSKEDIFNLIERIAKNEKLEISEEAKNALYEISNGDCRKLQNLMQSCAALSNKITEKIVFEVASYAKPKELKEIIELSKSNFIKARDKLLEVIYSQGISGVDLIKQFENIILGLNIDSKKKMKIIDRAAEIEFRMSEGSDEFLQLEALLSYIALILNK
ncbi:MAG: replication factor C small subunit [Candidatus Woesearchaeota archaeon]